MSEKFTLTLGLVYVIVISSYVNCIQIDNRLVSAQHGEFIFLQLMIQELSRKINMLLGC